MQHRFQHTAPFIIGLFLFFTSMQANGALHGESIVLNPSTGDYTITYWDYPRSPKKRLHQVIFVPATKIDPLMKSKFKLMDHMVTYTYVATNGRSSRQSLIALRFDPVSEIISALPMPNINQPLDRSSIEQTIAAGITALNTPDGWNGSSFTSTTGSGIRISWSYQNLHSASDGLLPGKNQGGFGFTSRAIPGIGIAQLSGNSPVPMYPAEGPTGELGKEFEKIENNDFVTRPAAIPTIAVPEPFDAAVTLERIQTHMHSWIAMQLLDPAFSAQLDRSFQSAISAYRLNQPKVGKQHIQAMRVLIKKEQPDADKEEADDDDAQDKNQRALIDKLAARVLDFDLKYVTKRMGGDD